MLKATLILANGAMFQGKSIGATADRVCEMVFNTSMTGYQEILTDPSYAGQGVVMSYPLIGNYGWRHLWFVICLPGAAISAVRAN